MANKKLKIERTEFRRKHSGEVVPYKKVILEKINDGAYLAKIYSWSDSDNVWYPSSKTSYFDGEKLVDTGNVCTRNNKDVDELFRLLIEYEKFKDVTDVE